MDWSLLSYAYAALLCCGGIAGFVKAKSTESLVAGVGVGLLMAALEAYVPRAVLASAAQAVVAGVLAATMNKRYTDSGKFMPAGLVASLSLVAAVVYAFRFIHAPDSGHAALAAAPRAARAARIDVACPARCESDLDCSLNGLCDVGSGVCACDAAWLGTCCSALNLEPASRSNGLGYRHPATSTWGGNILPVTEANGTTFHMWIAEMAPRGTTGDDGAGSCGLTTWGSNSQITHVTAAQPLGPYVRQQVAVPIWSHNPLVRRLGDTFAMFHIGSGSGGSPGQGYCGLNATSPCGEQGFDKCGPQDDPCNHTLSGWTCHANSCSGDAAAAARGDCGADLAEPALACTDYASCVPAAAAACAATPGCASFGLSSAWGFGKAKLFSAGAGGLTENAQWAVWVKGGGAASSAAPGHYRDMYGRARDAGRWPAPPRAVAADGSCNLEMHVSGSAWGPWVPLPNVSISPCGGNNPAPWVHPNGTVYLVVTDNDMGLYSAPSLAGPYALVTSGACGGGEDPSLFIDKRGHFHCMFHRSPFSVPDIAIGHAYSVDGFSWRVANDPAANSTINVQGLGPVVHGKRERPHP